MNIHTSTWLKRGALFLGLVVLASAVSAQLSADYEITKSVIAGGGGLSETADGSLRVMGTVGQMAGGESSSPAGDLSLQGGFWPDPAGVATAVEGPPRSMPKQFKLKPNYPNPFNPATTIRFDLVSGAPVRLEIYNVRGSLVRRLHTGSMPAGSHEFRWNGRDDNGAPMASGTYFVRLKAGAHIAQQKISLLK